ncbi:MAG: methionyl-tRNA formyltransferase [candidate division Zixibacteria bacterium SM23_73_2]|nr:MAG: methionyl-tRNA formyltransferase [candidate division Zixibacteria bacterium SM23_73_2]
MRILFMGTPKFALPSLEALLKSEHQIAGIITQPDRPRGRGRKLSPTPVKELALKNGLLVFDPEDLKSDDLVEKLEATNPDLAVVVAFRILPEKIFTIPPKGTINLHPSLLPKYRGAAPINWALIEGETKTGVTTFFIRKKVDTGNIILQREVEISPDENYGELKERLAKIGAELVIETVELIEKGEVKILSQDNSQATSAPKLTPQVGKIDWSESAEKIKNLIRGLSPAPGAYTFFRGKLLKIFDSEVVDEDDPAKNPGEVITADKNQGIVVKTRMGGLKPLLLQPEGKKRITAEEFLRGYRIEIGERLD